VTKMKYGSCHGVVVVTDDGRTFHARQEVISTLPLGVLQRKHAELFDPPLPPAQARLLSPESGFVMGNLTHIVVQFPHGEGVPPLSRSVSCRATRPQHNV
jgi:hypothetical protein